LSPDPGAAFAALLGGAVALPEHPAITSIATALRAHLMALVVTCPLSLEDAAPSS